MIEQDSDKIDLRSQDVNEVLSAPPHWLLRSGMSLLLMVVVLIILGTWFIKYPDIISGRAVISTSSPPVFIENLFYGRIDGLLAEDGQYVKKNDPLVTLTNPISREYIEELNELVLKSLAYLEGQGTYPVEINEISSLPETADFLLELKENLDPDDHERTYLNDPQFQSLLERKAYFNELVHISTPERTLAKNDSIYATEKFLMQKVEYDSGYITRLGFLNAQAAYNQSLRSLIALEKNFLQLKSNLSDIQNQIEEYKKEFDKRTFNRRVAINKSINGLKSFVDQWALSHIIVSPVEGRLTYLQRVKENQIVNAGDRLFAVIVESDSIEVHAKIPLAGFGKISLYDEVNVKVDNYPFEEYGTLRGRITKLSLLNDDEEYGVAIQLYDGLTTTYGRELKYTPEMTANIDVVTNDLRVFQIVFGKLLELAGNN